MRLFIGISVPPSIQTTVYHAAAQLAVVTSGQFVPPERYHITLAFLGQRGEDDLPMLQTILHETAADSAAFPVTVAGFDQFVRKSIIYAVIEQNEALATLCGTLRSRLSSAGEAFDPQPFTPHITLARKALLPADVPAPPPVSFSAEALTLFHSMRVDGILRYLPIFSVPFRLE